MTAAHKVVIIKKKVDGDVVQIDEEKLLNLDEMNNMKVGTAGPRILMAPSYSGICIRSSGDLGGKALFLPSEFNWVISRDGNGEDMLLIPYKK